MRLTVTADAATLTIQFLHCGTEPEFTDRNDEMRGNVVTRPVAIDWRRNRGVPTTIELPAGSVDQRCLCRAASRPRTVGSASHRS